MADDFSDLGVPAVTPAAPVAPAVADPSAPSVQASVPAPAVQAGVAAAAATPVEDFSDLGHPASGPTGSLAVDIPRRLGTAGTDFLGSALSLPRTLAQSVDYLGNKVGVDVGADKALAGVQQPGGGQLFPDAAKAREGAYQTTGATEYVPSTTLGRDLQAGLAAAPYAFAEGAGLATKAAAVLPTVVGGGVGEQAAEMLPDHPILARLAGFIFGAHSASAVANAAAKTAGMITGTAPTSDLYQAYQRQGVPTTLSGDVTQNPALQRLQSIATKMPGGEDAIREAGGEALDAWQAAAEKSATRLGPAATMADAGAGLQTAAQQWLQDFKQNSTNKWNTFKQAVPNDTPIKVGGFQQALQDVNQNFGGADGLAKALQPGLASKLQDALATDISPGGTLPWQAVQATRSRLGEMMEGGQPIGDTAQSAIKRLYAGLSNDMRDGANSAGPTAAKAFNQANAYTSFGHMLLDDHLTPILNATEPGQAAQYALAQAKIGGSRLAALNFAMPGQPANVGAAVLRQAAENGPGGLPTKLKNISPEAQNQLFNAPGSPPGPTNPSMQGVNDLSDIAQAMRRTVQTTGNNSNTAAHSASGLGRIMSAVEMGKMGHEIAGVPGAAAGAAAGLFAPNMIGRSARMLAANPLMSRIYSTETAPFNAPGMYSPNSLLQLASPDRRSLPGAGLNTNPLLFDPPVAGNAAISSRQ